MTILGCVRFNPCFYGSYSFTQYYIDSIDMNENVLILVFMEVILLQYVIIPIDDYKEYCFNPCFYGSYSFTQIFLY